MRGDHGVRWLVLLAMATTCAPTIPPTSIKAGDGTRPTAAEPAPPPRLLALLGEPETLTERVIDVRIPRPPEGTGRCGCAEKERMVLDVTGQRVLVIGGEAGADKPTREALWSVPLDGAAPRVLYKAARGDAIRYLATDGGAAAWVAQGREDKILWSGPVAETAAGREQAPLVLRPRGRSIRGLTFLDGGRRLAWIQRASTATEVAIIADLDAGTARVVGSAFSWVEGVAPVQDAVVVWGRPLDAGWFGEAWRRFDVVDVGSGRRTRRFSGSVSRSMLLPDRQGPIFTSPFDVVGDGERLVDLGGHGRLIVATDGGLPRLVDESGVEIPSGETDVFRGGFVRYDHEGSVLTRLDVRGQELARRDNVAGYAFTPDRRALVMLVPALPAAGASPGPDAWRMVLQAAAGWPQGSLAPRDAMAVRAIADPDLPAPPRNVPPPLAACVATTPATLGEITGVPKGGIDWDHRAGQYAATLQLDSDIVVVAGGGDASPRIVRGPTGIAMSTGGDWTAAPSVMLGDDGPWVAWFDGSGIRVAAASEGALGAPLTVDAYARPWLRRTSGTGVLGWQDEQKMEVRSLAAGALAAIELPRAMGRVLSVTRGASPRLVLSLPAVARPGAPDSGGHPGGDPRRHLRIVSLPGGDARQPVDVDIDIDAGGSLSVDTAADGRVVLLPSDLGARGVLIVTAGDGPRERRLPVAAGALGSGAYGASVSVVPTGPAVRSWSRHVGRLEVVFQRWDGTPICVHMQEIRAAELRGFELVPEGGNTALLWFESNEETPPTLSLRRQVVQLN